MPAQYDFKKKPDFRTEEERKNDGTASGTQGFYPQIVSKGTYSFQELAQQIADSSTFKVGDVVGIMAEMEKWILYYISQGYHVQVGNIGYASARLEAKRDVTNPAKRNAQSVEFAGVNFRISRTFGKGCSGRLERAQKAFRFQESKVSTEESRWQKLESYLKTHPYITRTEYGTLTGLLKTKALTDLQKWVKEGKLDTKGRAPHKVYMMAENPGQHP